MDPINNNRPFGRVYYKPAFPKLSKGQPFKVFSKIDRLLLQICTLNIIGCVTLLSFLFSTWTPLGSLSTDSPHVEKHWNKQCEWRFKFERWPLWALAINNKCHLKCPICGQSLADVVIRSIVTFSILLWINKSDPLEHSVWCWVITFYLM